MSLASLRHEPAAVTDPVGARIAELAAAWQATCLLEDTAGGVVSHALVGTAPACVVDAVLRRSSAPLHRARGAAQATGVVPGGPVLSTRLDAWDGHVTVLPVQGFGHLWLLHSRPLDLAGCVVASGGLADVLARTSGVATDESLLDALHGRVTAECAPGTSVGVLRPVSGALHPVELVAALRRTLGHGAGITATATEAYVVLRRADAAHQLEGALAQVAQPLVAAVAAAPHGLVAAREEAQRALDARSVEGRCLTTDECRPYAALPALLDAVAQPVVGRDPLELLDDVQAATLLAWLDQLGDLPAAARELDVHPNTFRYRLNRARALVRADLHDPVARLEVHLRLIGRSSRRP